MQYFGFDRPSFGIKTFGFGSSEFSPLDLFAGGKQGAWYDPSDKSTLFQDIAGTVPVTKDGDPVALMRDKSGNGNHAVQTVSTARPIYKTDGALHWLAFDGVDDMFFFNINFINKHICLGVSFSVLWSGAYLFDNRAAGGNIYHFKNQVANIAPVTPTTVLNTTLAPLGVYIERTLTTINKETNVSFMGANHGAECAKGNLYQLIILDSNNYTPINASEIGRHISRKIGVTL